MMPMPRLWQSSGLGARKFVMSGTLFCALLKMVSAQASCLTGGSMAGKVVSPVNLDICGSAWTLRLHAEMGATSVGKHLPPNDRLSCVTRNCLEIQIISIGSAFCI